MRVYHVTTPKKLAKYKQTRGILPPVRYWIGENSAKEWAKKTGRTIIIAFKEPTDSHPLPHLKGCAKWSRDIVREWEPKHD